MTRFSEQNYEEVNQVGVPVDSVNMDTEQQE